LTARYPDSNPVRLLADADPRGHPIRVVVADDGRRSRLIVLFRLLLYLPHAVWHGLWSIAALVAMAVNWLAALFVGRPVERLHHFLGSYLRYTTHVTAYVLLIGNPFPGFLGEPGSYPVDLEVAPPVPQRRLVTLFRLERG